MKKRNLIVSVLAIVVALSIFTGCSVSGTTPAGTPTADTQEKVLNIFTWEGYVPQNVLDDFTQKTGIKINFSNFDSNEEMLAKLQAAKGGSYDIVLASDYILDIARKEGDLLLELDKSRLPNYKNLDPNFQSQYYDPDNQYTIPYAAGSPLIVYDPAKVSVDIKGYSDLWNPALKDSLVLMDDGRNIIGITLKTLGQSFNTTDAAILEQAKAKLLELKPNIRVLDYNSPQKALINGEASVAYMFTPQVVEALNERPDLKVVYPAEGLGFGIDSIIVPKNAPHTNSAYAFIDYILDAKVGADISSQVLYLCPNKASVEYLPKDYLNNKALFIPSDQLGDTEFIQDVGSMTATYDEIWTAFKQQ